MQDKGGNNKNMQDINLAYQILSNINEKHFHDIYWGYTIDETLENIVYFIRAHYCYHIDIINILNIRKEFLSKNKDIQFEQTINDMRYNFNNDIKIKYRNIVISLSFLGIGFLLYPTLSNVSEMSLLGGILLYISGFLLLKDNIIINLDGKNISIFNKRNINIRIENIVEYWKLFEIENINVIEKNLINIYKYFTNKNIQIISINDLIFYGFIMGFEKTIIISDVMIIYKDIENYVLVILLLDKSYNDNAIKSLKIKLENDLDININDIYLVINNRTNINNSLFKIVIDENIKKAIYSSKINDFYTSFNIDPIERINDYIEKLGNFT